MGSINNRARIFGPHHQNHPPCTRTHQIGAVALVVVTFFVARLFDQSSNSCANDGAGYESGDDVVHFAGGSGGSIMWPRRGYGTHLSLKIYVYDENEIEGLKQLMYGRDGKTSADSCLKGQWGTQVKIHRMLLQSRFRTGYKEDADLFFVPAYTKCVRMMGALNDKEINQTYVKVLSQMPYFRLSGGRNHIFVFPSGAGAHLFKSWAVYLNRSIILTPEGDRTDKRDTSAFNTWKDIIIPGNVDDGMTTHGSRLIDPLPLSKRKYLANFLGRAQGKVGRLQLIELAKQFPDKLESPELKFSGPDKLGKVQYFQHLGNAKFCLAPRGESSWTLRFYESFFVVSLSLSLTQTHARTHTHTNMLAYAHGKLLMLQQECVPVILSDEVELPFQNVVDYTRISIKWPSTHIGPQLLNYLESIPNKDIEDMIARGRKVRCLWVYAPESKPCSVFNGILWELQRKVRKFHQSAETFWLHNGSVVNRNLVEFRNWKPPVPLP